MTGDRAADTIVVGAGIVGLAVAAELLRTRPGSRIVVLEKEHAVGLHQTGHNSGVIHSGIYYEPGSLKARLCRAGSEATRRFAAERGIPVLECGKLIVAAEPGELPRLNALAERARVNGVRFERLDAAEIRRREPAIRGVGALLLPETGTVDYGAITRELAALVAELGGEVRLGSAVTGIRESSTGVELETDRGYWRADRLVACGGLQADRLVRMSGIRPGFRIVPFRGEYYRLSDRREGMISHHVYPVPEPGAPFLGVHLTRTMDGGLTAGPNAVLGLAREGYPRYSVNPRDAWELASYPGMWRMALANAHTGLREMRDSVSKRAYLSRCRRYCPELELDDLRPMEAGIRAQAVQADGTLVHDFLFRATERALHVCNAPSPAATSALPIAREVVARLRRED